jgi:hypothetical protein
MRARGAGSADGRNGRREAVGNWGLKAGRGQCHCLPRAASAIMTNRARLSRIFLLTSLSLNFRRAKKKADHWIAHFPLTTVGAERRSFVHKEICGKR